MQADAVSLDEFKEAVELVGGDKGVYRVAEQEQIRSGQSPARRGEVLLQPFDLLPCVERREGMLRVQRL